MKKQSREVSQRGGVMPGHQGRAERRILMETPLELTKLREPAHLERAKTENVCSFGARIVTRRALKPGDQFLVSLTSNIGKLRTKARVVYCQALSKGLFGVGLRFEKAGGDFISLIRGTTGND
jgi:hypothetical protein